MIYKIIKEQKNLKRNIEHTIQEIEFISKSVSLTPDNLNLQNTLNKFNRQMKTAERYGIQTDKYYEMIQGN